MSTDLLQNLAGYAEGLIKQHNVPAISMAVWHDSQLHQAAAGILNIETGVEATTDSIFQIGSITKVFTASLVMQLVDEGRIALDAPVNQYLRDFRVADPDATKAITVRQLLAHTSGVSGDFFPDDLQATGNPIARYVDRCNLLPQIHSPGEMYSYCNAGYSIAGRLVEVMLGISWFEAIEDRIFEPLGMAHSIARPTETLRFRAAIGHIADSDNEDQWNIAPAAYLSLGNAPAGSTLTMSASDLIKFARVHLNEGRTELGDQWLPAGTVAQMQIPQLRKPRITTLYDQYVGLGWHKSLLNPSGTPVLNHTGGTIGQTAMLKLFPDQNLICVVLVNAKKEGVLDAISRELILGLTGIDWQEPEAVEISADPIELRKYTGTFESLHSRYEVTLEHGVLVATLSNKNLEAPAVRFCFRLIGQNYFVARADNNEHELTIAFLRPDDDGIPAYLYSSGRLHKRVR